MTCQECMIDLVVPTGAMGNITGGYIAKQMGVPIGMLCAGVNINGKNLASALCCLVLVLIKVLVGFS